MKSFKRYLIPSIIASVFLSTYAIIDGIFIGQKIGDIGLSAINIAWPITSFIQAIGLALGLSGGIYISTLIGNNRIEDSNRMKLTTLIIILAISIALGIILLILSEYILILFGAKDLCLEYGKRYIRIILLGSPFQMLGVGLAPLLKNSGRVKIAMTGSLASIVVNLVLDYVFIYPLNMGLDGAALASVIAQLSAFLVCIIPYTKELKGVLFNKESMKNLFSGALAPFILNFSYSFIIIITNAVCLYFGGNEAVAAYTLLSYLLYVVGAIATGVADAIQPLFSYHFAKRDYLENHKMVFKCLCISFMICLFVSILFYFLEEPLGELYNLSDVAKGYYSSASIFYLVGFMFVSISRVICSYFYSINNKRKANTLTLLEPIGLTPLIYLVFCPGLKITGVWLGFMIIQILLCGVSILMLILNIKKEKNCGD